MGNHSHSLIDPPTSYPQLPNSSQRPVLSGARKQPMSLFASMVALAAFLASLLVLVFLHQTGNLEKVPAEISGKFVTRGRALGVSDKSSLGPPLGLNKVYGYNWSNAMLSWQRTAYHFQPEKNWMNDPDGPLFHKGWYHLFYQYNPDSAIWGNITWGHAVSKDLIHWLYLPIAMIPDCWFDSNGVWTGSATLLPDGQIVMLYTGDTNNYVQVQNLAYPANLSDPLLLDWIKYPNNPVMVPPDGIAPKDFRDPTTAWQGPNGTWRVMVGSKHNKTGIALVYQTSNFTSYELLDGLLHAVDGTGMWECVDFYPVSTTGVTGLDTSAKGPGIKHVLKSSLDDNKHDYYALGTYDPLKNTWTPDHPELDVGIGLRVDYGKYYASKTFYDQSTERRILWGWVGETDSEVADIKKGWASVQTIPREVTFDQKTGANLIQWPVAELESLRTTTSSEFSNVEVGPGSVVPVDFGSATQLDIIAEFEIDEESLEDVREENVDADYACGDNLGAASTRGKLGPFGILTIADEALTEFTPIYFYVTRSNGSFRTWFCTDQTRSSAANDVGRLVYGSEIPVLTGEKFSARILVDHSVVESFGQGGRTVITARVYPTKAIYGAAKLFLFNNATDVSVKATLKIWQLSNAFIRPFPFDEIDSV